MVLYPNLQPRTLAEIEERIDQHIRNLNLWGSGYLNPTEPDEHEREVVKERLRVAIRELKWVLKRGEGMRHE